MRYVSTRGNAPILGFADVMLAGLARDGGLYVPEAWPEITAEQWGALAGLSYPALAARLFAPFMAGAGDNLPAGEALERLLSETYAGFNHPAVTPLVQIGANDWILELFHGPTLAFKDLALQVLGRLMERVLEARGGHLTIVVATSGDTGSAAIEAFRDQPHIDVFVLHPKGRVSDTQRRQMTCVLADNVHNIALDGTFDDAQGLVKAMFNDHAFRDRMALAAVNSINWARVMAQTVYFAQAALCLGAPHRAVAFAVPTGNFGDILAGYVVKRMGLAVDRLLIATNVNDILARTLKTGRYAREPVQATQSPSMDIQISSNFERLLFDAFDRSGRAVETALGEFNATGAFNLGPNALAHVRADFDAACVGEAETTATIRDVARQCGYVIDPHTAVGVAAGRAARPDPAVPLVCLATAHPAKFPDAVRRAIGREPETPERLRALADKPERLTVLANDLSAVQGFIAERSRFVS